MPSPKTSLAGDPSEVTALGKRHWITSFRCVDGNPSIGADSPDVKGLPGTPVAVSPGANSADIALSYGC
jgi:hypothetical protein